MKDITMNDIEKMIAALWPAVGDIEINVSGTNPSEKYPSTTWESWGTGKVPVGVDTNDSDFNTAEKTGGNKTVAHSHAKGTALSNGATGATSYVIGSGNSVSGAATSTVQPYITCYMWKRTA